jgi:NAD(P)-dependent dehydrogenase (short-subunit alcohol dehydrogenase family)
MTTAFRDDKALHEDLVDSIPLGRGCDPKEVSRAILFLASDEASYITGHGKLLIIA